MEDPGRTFRSGVTVESYISNLVEFLISVGQQQRAIDVAKSVAHGVQDLVPLGLPEPKWVASLQTQSM
jgi:hypothetical protein